jgi:cytochrome c-type biogenesis protein CcmF
MAISTSRWATPRAVRGAWTVRLYYNPLVHLIFIGAIMMALGGGLSLLALARRKRSGA